MNIISVSGESAVIDIPIDGQLYRLNVGGLAGVSDIETYLQEHEADYVAQASTLTAQGIGLRLAPVISVLQDEACARIDAAAEALRQTVLTPGAGQMAAYQAKEAQARALLQDPEPDETKYPDIYNEIGITADTVQGVAVSVVTAADRWRLFGRDIEKARLAGKKAVNAATGEAAIQAAEAAVVWPVLP